MTTTAQLASAYHRALALRWSATVLSLPVLVPLMLARGLDLAQVALVMATFAAAAAALEVPTGGLADAFGRVRTTVVADALALTAQLGFLLAPGLGGLLVAAALGGAARALGSGALEAWYVDEFRRLDPLGDLRAPLARAGVVEATVLALGTLAGGALPLVAPLLGIAGAGDVRALQLPPVGGPARGGAAPAAPARRRAATPAPGAGGRPAHGAARPDRVARAALRALRRDPSLLGLLAIGAAFGAVVMSFESFLPADLRARWGAEGVSAVLGIVMAGAFGATAAGQAWAARRAASASHARLTTVVHGGLAMAAGAALVVVDPARLGAGGAAAVTLAAAGAWVAYLGLGFAGPALGAAFHARVASHERATLLSVRSLAAYAGAVATTLALGPVAEAIGLVAVWIAVIAVAATAAGAALAWRAPTADGGAGSLPVNEAA